jgi:hypothetical protein
MWEVTHSSHNGEIEIKSIDELIKKLFELARVEYTQEDTMMNVPSPEDTARDVIKEFMYQVLKQFINPLI